ncbi:MAG: hypothetical protein KatS3mg081_2347 [Gemmatimonadales bacterium]|nr:Light-independent protochlorophyllide reductase subunit B [bacterium HR33]GIW52992.1 MAG: hypothetical protein KatS3mg081_2347 [Gemmatimonadales bacterium]
MKFLCLECNERMVFEEREVPGDGTFSAAFSCPGCGRRIALLANPMETQLVEALGVKVGGSTLQEKPMELVRSMMVGGEEVLSGARSVPVWSEEAKERLSRVPAFVRGMVKKLYTDYAAARGIAEITPSVMDRAREDLGLEGM